MVKNLRRLRLLKGVSQQNIADYLNISQQSVFRYEKDKIEPDISTLILLADYFGTTVDYLIGHEAPASENAAELCEPTRGEWNLLRDFRRLSKEEKDSILLVIRNYLKR